MRRIARLLCLAALMAPQPALAQSRAERAERAERDGARAARVDALAPPEDPSPGAGLAPDSPDGRPAWTMDLLLPVYFNSNPEKLPRRARGTGEATPELRVGWSTRLARLPVQLSALADVSNDRFGRASAADADIVYLRFRAQYDTGEDDQEFKPFLDIQPTREFAPGFASRLESRLDVDAGFTVQANLDRALRRLPRSPDSSAATFVTLGLNASVQRRWRSPFTSSVALIANPSLTLTLAPNLGVSLELEVTRRIFDEVPEGRRRDWLVTPVLTLEWAPRIEGWPPAAGQPAIALQVFGSRQRSNRRAFDHDQWGAGPVLRTSWRF
ncbi:MAG: hypothetical protein MUC64_03300 [Rubritepida sp.]|nr:hypothetical protein [Rubritepida sp.]